MPGTAVPAQRPGRLVFPVLLGAFGFFGLFAGTFAVLLADLLFFSGSWDEDLVEKILARARSAGGGL